MNKILPALLACLLLLFNTMTSANSDAFNMLERMETVAKELNYDGVFSYQSGDKLQSIRIIHRADRQGEVERLVSLNGVAREVIRHDEMVTCIYPEGSSVQENHRPLGRGFPSDLLNRLSAAADYYTISYGRQDRVAGQNAQQLIVSPIDVSRYGYHLWVDKHHNLLLQADLVDHQGQILDSFAFSSIELNIDIADHSLKPLLQGNEMTWNRKEQQRSRMSRMMTMKSSEKVDSLWTINWLPAGFSLVAQKKSFKLNNGAAVEQQVYSDGLSSVSIFFEKIQARHGHLRGSSYRGAVHVYGSISNAHFITVVGEVPAETVEKIANSIVYQGDAND